MLADLYKARAYIHFGFQTWSGGWNNLDKGRYTSPLHLDSLQQSSTFNKRGRWQYNEFPSAYSRKCVRVTINYMQPVPVTIKQPWWKYWSFESRYAIDNKAVTEINLFLTNGVRCRWSLYCKFTFAHFFKEIWYLMNMIMVVIDEIPTTYLKRHKIFP